MGLLFTSPKHKMLKVSYCAHILSIVGWLSFINNCLVKHSSWKVTEQTSLSNLGLVLHWVMWGQKLGHKAKWKENLVNTLETTYFASAAWYFVIKFAFMIFSPKFEYESCQVKT